MLVVEQNDDFDNCRASPAEMIAQNRALRGPYPHSSCCEIIGKQENKNVTKSRNLKVDKVLSVF